MNLGVTGTRPKGSFNPRDDMWVKAYDRVVKSIERHGATMLLSGGARGFDMVASKAAVDVGCGLELVLPYPGYDDKWTDDDRRRMTWLSERCTFIHFLADEGHSNSKYHARNRFIVDNSDMVLAYWDGKSRGTKSVLDYAVKQEVPWEVVEW